jgi:hypothetical protein
MVFISNAYASNFKAQGYYYKAKSEYEAHRYSSAILYAKKSIAELHGTNEELEYLLVLCYYKQKDWINADKELNIYGATESHEKSVSVKQFDENVERLTNDEKKSLAKLMVKIMESAEETRNYRSSKQYKIEQLIKKAEIIINENANKNRKRYVDDVLRSKRMFTHIQGTKYKTTYLKYFDHKLDWKAVCEFDLADVVSASYQYKKHPTNLINRVTLFTREHVKMYQYAYDTHERLDEEVRGCSVELKGDKDYLQSKVKELNDYFHQIAALSGE